MDQPLHSWDLDPAQAVELQRRLASLVVERPLPAAIEVVAGVDVGYCRHCQRLAAAVVVCELPSLEPRQVVEARAECTFPYIPGLLSFREIPSMLAAWDKLEARPQAVLCDGQGGAHPRRLGLAVHLGLWLQVPTVGCAKSRLLGEHQAVASERGSWQPLYHQGAEIGRVVRTRTGVKPVYVSAGHLADLQGSQELVLTCCGRFRLPEPLRQAHLRAQAGARSCPCRVGEYEAGNGDGAH